MYFHMFKTFFISLLLVAMIFIPARCAKYTPMSGVITFQIKNAGVTVNGSISGIKAQIVLDQEDLSASKIYASVAPSTINTGIKKRDRHLQEAEYFDSKSHSEIIMNLISVKKSNQGFIGVFELTMKGIKKQITMPFTISEEGGNHIFNGTLALNRRDFNVGGSSMIMSDNVSVQIKITAKR